ncbi:hypothetical protein ABZ667_00345 [Streptomyces lavendulae]
MGTAAGTPDTTAKGRLRAVLAVLAFAAVVALFFTQRIPDTQPRAKNP